MKDKTCRPLHYVFGINGTDADHRVDNQLRRANRRGVMSAGEIGCFASHRIVWKLFLETQQAHVADRQGNAIVLGLDERGELSIAEKPGQYLVSTNFSLARNPAGGDTDRRYKKAAAMLERLDPLTGEGCAAILEETALSMVMYSYVVDLKAGTIALVSRGDFSRSAMSKLKCFSSGVPGPSMPTAPGSEPPWPGSMQIFLPSSTPGGDVSRNQGPYSMSAGPLGTMKSSLSTAENQYVPSASPMVVWNVTGDAGGKNWLSHGTHEAPPSSDQ